MKIYLVGGAVRDKLMGIPIKDRDWVVIGATPEEMIREGYIAVGEDFPVFLHPETKEEYALARTERKSGKGYKGFVFYSSPEITLEDDLKRRDLTINAIAEDEDGNTTSLTLVNNPHRGGMITLGKPHRPGDIAEWRFPLIKILTSKIEGGKFTLRVSSKSIFYPKVEPPAKPEE